MHPFERIGSYCTTKARKKPSGRFDSRGLLKYRTDWMQLHVNVSIFRDDKYTFVI